MPDVAGCTHKCSLQRRKFRGESSTHGSRFSHDGDEPALQSTTAARLSRVPVLSVLGILAISVSEQHAPSDRNEKKKRATSFTRTSEIILLETQEEDTSPRPIASIAAGWTFSVPRSVQIYLILPDYISVQPVTLFWTWTCTNDTISQPR